jgi:NADH-quinone oxidoreductase subunit J
MTALALTISGAAAVIFAGLMLFQRSLYVAAICLLAVILQTAAIFFLSGAPLLAFLQIMIYAGAVMVLVVVTIMAAPASADRLFAAGWGGRSAAAAVAALLGAQLACVGLAAKTVAAAPREAAVLQERLGPVLFGPYAVATEAVTLLMFVSALALVARGPRARTSA